MELKEVKKNVTVEAVITVLPDVLVEGVEAAIESGPAVQTELGDGEYSCVVSQKLCIRCRLRFGANVKAEPEGIAPSAEGRGAQQRSLSAPSAPESSGAVRGRAPARRDLFAEKRQVHMR